MTSKRLLFWWAWAWFFVGMFVGLVLVERLAPGNPLWFCRPNWRTNTCEPYPWR